MSYHIARTILESRKQSFLPCPACVWQRHTVDECGFNSKPVVLAAYIVQVAVVIMHYIKTYAKNGYASTGGCCLPTSASTGQMRGPIC